MGKIIIKENADANGVKIANGVSDFEIPADGKFVVYQKANKLYYSNLKKDIIIDALTLTASAQQKEVLETVKTGDTIEVTEDGIVRIL